MRRRAFILAMGIFGCSPQDPGFSGFEAMEGQWQAAGEDGIFYESWTIENGRMQGQGFLVNQGDTAFGEKLVVEQIESKLVYIAAVANQNPTLFTCVKQRSHTWVFENTEHDFPQTITYTLQSDTRLEVSLAGMGKEGPHNEKLVFEKVAP